ncbi:NADPH-dependent 2,4-dienoyl-CoA reductase/sulfur reductase-like enzyme [Friedmanniella endophytica]|uniref:NADPH-dependent 2,4-dienoyl-CoA reductase/sulfur reductase-like enzyme n=1 Tax=Microlunatus kandeliicorticis TaxID=1759536 RepID=A0A7W3P790_9ACTN|nr:FAD/NAD(P)-binding oxidoreductase [Microlunatus kandeliicorticis]MBA8795735.1 NADPH-dependent 2,4-dienoyl-CoA reductase/sulfur reductase-like enzyme [Microlunatus kandeliicorticis]
MTDRYDYLIIGGGMAADAAARGIRELDDSGTIGILSADADPPYQRPPLSKDLWQEPEEGSDDTGGLDTIWLNTADDTGADVRLRTVVTGIDRDGRQVSTESGELVGYGKLLLATGSRPNRIEGLPEDERVVYFRSAQDYQRVRSLAGAGEHAVVVGGGYIATEVAAGLSRTGAKVSVVFTQDTFGSKTLPAEIASGVEQDYRDHGVTLHPGRRVTRGVATDENLVLTLDDGTDLEADVVVVGVGAAPVVDLAADAGLEVGTGVIVDEHLRTADPLIWAVGDVAEYPDPVLGRTRVEHVDQATESGKAAGRAMAGDEAAYTHTPFFWSDLYDNGYEAIGRLDGSLDTLVDWSEDHSAAVVYYLENETPTGVLLWNTWDSVEQAQQVLADPPARREDLLGRITPGG